MPLGEGNRVGLGWLVVLFDQFLSLHPPQVFIAAHRQRQLPVHLPHRHPQLEVSQFSLLPRPHVCHNPLRADLDLGQGVVACEVEGKGEVVEKDGVSLLDLVVGLQVGLQIVFRCNRPNLAAVLQYQRVLAGHEEEERGALERRSGEETKQVGVDEGGNAREVHKAIIIPPTTVQNLKPPWRILQWKSLREDSYLLLSLPTDRLYIRHQNSLCPRLPIIVGAVSSLGLAQVDVLAVVAHPHVEVPGVVGVQFEEDAGSEGRVSLAVEGLRAALPVELLDAECRRDVEIVLQSHQIDRIDAKRTPLQCHSLRRLHSIVEVLHHLRQLVRAVGPREIKRPCEVPIPIRQVLQVSEVLLVKAGRQRDPQVLVCVGLIVDGSQFGEVHRGRINFEGSSGLLEEGRVGQHHLIILRRLLLNVPVDLCLLVGTRFKQARVVLHRVDQLAFRQRINLFCGVIVVSVGWDMVFVVDWNQLLPLSERIEAVEISQSTLNASVERQRDHLHFIPAEIASQQWRLLNILLPEELAKVFLLPQPHWGDVSPLHQIPSVVDVGKVVTRPRGNHSHHLIQLGLSRCQQQAKCDQQSLHIIITKRNLTFKNIPHKPIPLGEHTSGQ